MEICADGAAIHRSQSVRNWLHRRPGRVHLERLPAYSPMLNPPGRPLGLGAGKKARLASLPAVNQSGVR